MASINVATETYVDAVLAQSVVSGTINGSGHLILTKHDASTFDAGDFSTIITTLINSIIASASLIKVITSVTAVGDVPLTAKGMAGQTGDLQRWTNSANAILAKVTSAGKFTAAAIENTVIDGSLNTTSKMNAIKLDGHLVTINTVAPSSPATNDIWINPAGT